MKNFSPLSSIAAEKITFPNSVKDWLTDGQSEFRVTSILKKTKLFFFFFFLEMTPKNNLIIFFRQVTRNFTALWECYPVRSNGQIFRGPASTYKPGMDKNKSLCYHGGRRHWAVYYTIPQSFMVTLSYSLAQQLWDCCEFW